MSDKEYTLWVDDITTTETIIVSAAWATKEIGCTPGYIPGGCSGKCCKVQTIWNPTNDGTSCPSLGENGCNFSPATRSIICLLYPFQINRNNKLVFHGRALLHYCKPNYKVGGKTIWEQNRVNLVELFGVEQFERVLQDILGGNDSWINATPEFFEELKAEAALFRAGVEQMVKITPPERTKGSWVEK